MSQAVLLWMELGSIFNSVGTNPMFSIDPNQNLTIQNNGIANCPKSETRESAGRSPHSPSKPTTGKAIQRNKTWLYCWSRQFPITLNYWSARLYREILISGKNNEGRSPLGISTWYSVRTH